MSGVQKINLSNIKKCPVDWYQMKPTEGGRICQQCDKKITDFRKMSDQEIAEKHTFSTSPICGLYTKGQLTINLEKKSNDSISTWRSLQLLMMGWIASNSLSAHNIPTQPPIEQTLPSPNKQDDSVAPLDSNETSKQKIVFSGTIREQKENGDTATVPFCNIHIQGAKIGTSSDVDGNYSLVLPDSFNTDQRIKLVFSYIGFVPVLKPIDSITSQRINATFTQRAEIIEFGLKLTWRRKVWHTITHPFRYLFKKIILSLYVTFKNI